MTVTTRIPGRPDWAAGPLYTLMMEIFPDHRTKLGVLDIPRLTGDLNKSHEAIYKWLRQGKMKPSNARAIIEAANSDENKEALAKAGRKVPEIEEFMPFFL